MDRIFFAGTLAEAPEVVFGPDGMAACHFALVGSGPGHEQTFFDATCAEGLGRRASTFREGDRVVGFGHPVPGRRFEVTCLELSYRALTRSA